MTEAEFDIYRRLDNDADSDGTGSNSADTSSAGWTPDELVGRVTADSVTFTDTDPTLQPGTEYEYAVAAHNEAGDSFSTPPLDVATSPATGPQPNAPNGVAAQGGANQVTLTWSAPTPVSGITVTSFDVYRQNAVTAWAGNTTTTWTLVNVVPVPSPDTGEYSYTDKSLDPGTTYNYQATAVSNGSQSPPAPASATTSAGPPIVQIVSPAAYKGVSVVWGNPDATTSDGRITKLTEVMAVVDGDFNPLNPAGLSWTLSLVPAGTGTAEGTPTITLASGTGPVGSALDPAGAPIFALDPSLYPSGDYELTLTAKGADGQQASPVQTLVSLFSPAKLGGLTLPVTDLTVPVPGGQPITITRVYDSQQADVKGDFGYGWSLQATTSALRLVTEPPSGGYPGTTAFRPGDLVYITIPVGGQHVFQFWPVPNSYQPGHAGNPYDPLSYQNVDTYAAQFICVDGSGSTLTPADSTMLWNDSAYLASQSRIRYLMPSANPLSAMVALRAACLRTILVPPAPAEYNRFSETSGNPRRHCKWNAR